MAKASKSKASGKKAGKKPATKKAAGQPAAKKTAPKKSAKPAAKKSAKPVAKKTTKAPAKTTKSAHEIKAAQKARPQHLKLVTDMSAFVTPLDDRVLVRLSGSERTTASGLLFIPDTVSDTSGNLEGLVVAIGRGRRNKKGQVRPMDLQLGDRVVFAEYAGSKINIQNEELVLLREAEVMGVLS